MFLIVIFFFIFLLRKYIVHLPKLVYFGVIDLFNYIKYKKYNLCNEFGKLVVYEASDNQSFGCGKTFSCVDDICNIYNKYNNKTIYCDGEWKKQNIIVLSNIEFQSIPYIPLGNFNNVTKYISNLNDNDVLFIFLDEAGANMNSRAYKDNLNSALIMSILTMRHHKVSLFLTTQRFTIIDALLRQVTYEVIRCKRSFLGRLYVNKYVDGYNYEVGGVDKIKYKKLKVRFATNKRYNQYNSFADIPLLDKNAYLDDEEIINNISSVRNNSNRNDFKCLTNVVKEVL